jgi:hypothetical protein
MVGLEGSDPKRANTTGLRPSTRLTYTAREQRRHRGEGRGVRGVREEEG